jgi:hypothetical protein
MLPLAIALCVLVGISLGLLGGGGSILTTPILLYVLGLPANEAIALSLVVVGVTSLVGAFEHARAGDVDLRVGLLFGGAGMAGAYAGGLGSAWVPEPVLLGLFAAMMLVAAAALFRGRGSVEGRPVRPRFRFALDGFGVGLMTGLVGAGGGFVVVPALGILGGLPMRKAIGTSLLVIALNTAAAFLGHAVHTRLDYGLAAALSTAAVVGSFIGRRLGQGVPHDRLRRGFAGFVVLMAGFVLCQQL